jgi:Fe2+ transport system protein B
VNLGAMLSTSTYSIVFGTFGTVLIFLLLIMIIYLIDEDVNLNIHK